MNEAAKMNRRIGEMSIKADKEKEPVVFSDFDLSEINFGDPKKEEGAEWKKEIYETVLPISVEDKVFDLRVLLKKMVYPPVRGMDFDEYEFFISSESVVSYGDDNSELYAKITLEQRNGMENAAAFTVIQRKKEDSLLPKGIGIKMYEKMMDFISAQADILHQKVEHIVTYEAKMGLDREKWRLVFNQTLKDRGYTYTGWEGGDVWRKVYFPKDEPST